MSKEIKENINDQNEYAERLNEWQDHQYDPGYYTGGNIPPVLTNPGRPNIVGCTMIVSAYISFVVFIVILLRLFNAENIIGLSVIGLIFIIFCSLQFIGGLRLIKKAVGNDGIARIVKRIIAFTLIIIIIIFSILIANLLLTKYATLDISDMERIRTEQVNGENYIIIDEKIRLRCNQSQLFDVWAVKVTDGAAEFKIKYKWNIIWPENYPAVEVTRLY